MARIIVQAEDFELGRELAMLTAGNTRIGGVGSFIGVVRDAAGTHRLRALTLEHYPRMTEQAIARIAAQAEQRWELLGCTIIHRIGALHPGDNIVLVLAAAPHRHAALESTAFLIDWLKTKAPFWKKEGFIDGTERWVESCDADDHAAARWLA